MDLTTGGCDQYIHCKIDEFRRLLGDSVGLGSAPEMLTYAEKRSRLHCGSFSGSYLPNPYLSHCVGNLQRFESVA
jgi:hypothetical protein